MICVCYVICDSFFFPQYIFGDFSPDELNQFFVTPRASVEVRQNFILLSTCIDLIDAYVLDLLSSLLFYLGLLNRNSNVQISVEANMKKMTGPTHWISLPLYL